MTVRAAGGRDNPVSLLPPETKVGIGETATSPAGVQSGCPERTGPSRPVRPGLVHTALTCWRVLGFLASSTPTANPSLQRLGSPSLAAPPGEESHTTTEKEDKHTGQVRPALSGPCPLCSPGSTPAPGQPWPLSSSAVSLPLIVPDTFLWRGRRSDRGRGEGGVCFSPKPGKLQNFLEPRIHHMGKPAASHAKIWTDSLWKHFSRPTREDLLNPRPTPGRGARRNHGN